MRFFLPAFFFPVGSVSQPIPPEAVNNYPCSKVSDPSSSLLSSKAILVFTLLLAYGAFFSVEVSWMRTELSSAT